MEKPIQDGGESKNPLRAEHLIEGVSPIISCIGTEEDFGKDDNPMVRDFIGRSFLKPGDSGYGERSSDVYYWEDQDDLKAKNIKSSGRDSYVISPVDSSDKFSIKFVDCTGVIATGIDKETGKNISFLSHQNPKYFLGEGFNKEQFIRDLRGRMEELKGHSLEGTIDVVIFGGNYFKKGDGVDDIPQRYIDSVNLLSKEAEDVFGFEPVVITGPKRIPGGDSVFYDTNNRRLYIMRPKEADETSKSYLPGDIEEQSKKW